MCAFPPLPLPDLLTSIPAEKKEALSKARYEQLAEQGGQRAVKKAIAKKQRKISQKEKRSRPIPQPELPAAKRRKT